MNEIMSDRRRHRRIQVGDGAFVSLGTPGRKLWHILDISPGGLAFRYMQDAATPKGSSELEIVTRDTSFSLDHLHFRIVSDTEVKSKTGSPPNLRRCGVEFMPLTTLQTSQLDLFMGRYCSGPH